MRCPVRIARRFLSIVLDKYVESGGSQQSTSQVQSQELAECELANSLLTLFESMLYAPPDTQETLDYASVDDYYECLETEFSQEVVVSEEQLRLYNEEQEKIEHIVSQFSLDYMKNVVDFAKIHKFKTVQHRFKRVLQYNYITRFRNYIANLGTRNSKCAELNANVLQRFAKARRENLQIHDMDLRRWAIQEAATINLTNFKASDFWIISFKARNKICSRKIVQIVTTGHYVEAGSILQTANDFVENANKVLTTYDADHVLNIDQSGFNYELKYLRTLAHKGEKRTIGAVKSKNATTHSYSIQPTISMFGKLIGKLYMCLQETGGSFGPTVEKNLFRPPNIELSCSSSGKLTKRHVKESFSAILPFVSEKFVLLYDSWSGQTDDATYNAVCNRDRCVRLQIPPKTTALIQPCDVFFFRQWKIFAKNLYYRVPLDQLPCNLHQRNNIIKTPSLIHNQFSSVKFAPMIRYAWFKSGYDCEQPMEFQNVSDICFNYLPTPCGIGNCRNLFFVKCSWCEKFLCFHHFFEQFHFHESS